MQPVILFKYSRIYNAVLKSYLEQDLLEQIPVHQQILMTKDSLVKYWEKGGDKILSSISRVSLLDWKSSNISVYLTAYSKSFSDPLTIPISELKKGQVRIKEERFLIATLVHELIHRILIDNPKTLGDYYKWVKVQYPKESRLVHVHVFVHAVQTGVLLDLGMEELLKDVRSKSVNKDYVRAWDIVKEEGYENIIDKIYE